MRTSVRLVMGFFNDGQKEIIVFFVNGHYFRFYTKSESKTDLIWIRIVKKTILDFFQNPI